MTSQPESAEVKRQSVAANAPPPTVSLQPGYQLTLSLHGLPPAVPTNADAPLQFGDYEIVRKIAAGGMGVVYEARQQSLQRTVALKMIRSGDLAEEIEIARFCGQRQ